MKLSLKIILSALLAILAVACTSTRTQESAGEYIDNAAITAKVKARLVDEQQVHGLNVKVKTYKGVVQLSGFVDSAKEKREAERVTRSVPNVRGVINNIVVKR